MDTPTPLNANDFIQQQLDGRLRKLETYLGADVLAFWGGFVYGVDDIFRKVVENRKRQSNSSQKMAIILTTFCGSIEVAHRMVDTVRRHYSEVDFVIPNSAYSAGTVFALSGDTIYMDYYSRLGPIDPQVEGSNGKWVPALGYLAQYERLIEKSRNKTISTAEVQILLEKFDPAALYQYEQARELSVSLLREWLVKYKFKNWTETETRQKRVTEAMKQQRAEQIARELNNTDRWHVHGYGISMQVLQRDLKLRVTDFGAQEELRTLVKEYYDLLSDFKAKLGYPEIMHIVGEFAPIR